MGQSMLRIFEIEVVNAKFFALKEELEQCDKIEEPLVIRANTGDYIELHITDTIDKEVITKCFFAGNKPDTILYQHDGIYGAIVIEEEGASFYNPHNSKKLCSGTQAVIRRKDGTSFREFILFVHSFEQTRGINYCIEPTIKRLENDKDPAYMFSSLAHGDPATPILEAYPSDELVIYVLDCTHNRQGYHSFNIAGMGGHWNPDKCSLNIVKKYSAGDYIYYFDDIQNISECLWGIVRVYGQYRENLVPLYNMKEQDFSVSIFPKSNDVINHYEIIAIYTEMIYNRYEYNEPNRIILLPIENLEMVLAGKLKPEPLILSPNAGEWIEVILHNAVDIRIF